MFYTKQFVLLGCHELTLAIKIALSKSTLRGCCATAQ